MWPLLFFFTTDVTTVIIETLALLLIFFLTLSFIKHLSRDLHITIRDETKKHSWCERELSMKPCYCCVCESFLVTTESAYCDSCGAVCDEACIKEADRNLKCKPVTSANTVPVQHHWVKGNVNPDAVCDYCGEECEGEPGHLDRQCCWCQRAVHSSCESKISQVCDFGRFWNLIIPPNCIVVSKHRKKIKLKAVNPPPLENWRPLIVVANRKSGNNDGGTVLSLFRRVLNPAQVIDLSLKSPELALEWCNFLADAKTTVLVAGGDGTIGWVLNTIEKLNLQHKPSVAIVPLGTGNDLSRVLGWGKGHDADLDAEVILEQIQRASEVMLDRWHVSVNPARHLGIRKPSRQMFMYNYLSIGVDAQVALDFHRTRESPFYLFSSRIFNKFLYLGFGTKQAAERSYQELQERIDLYIDKKQINLPSIESIVILNIPSWGAGVYLWSMGDENTAVQSISDGKLEVVALFSSFHIAQLQMGLSQPYRIGQGREISIVLKSATAVQVDGEPWWQSPGKINITFRNQANMLQLTENLETD